MCSTNVAVSTEVKIIALTTLEAIPRNSSFATIVTLDIMKGHAEIAPLCSTTEGTRTGTWCSVAMHAMIPTAMKNLHAQIGKSLECAHAEHKEICHFNNY